MVLLGRADRDPRIDLALAGFGAVALAAPSPYYLLDIGAFPKDELARRASVVALLFRLDAWRRQWVAEGFARGKAEALLCLLVERFGPVAPSWRKRIHGAKLTTIERWLKRAIVAPDLSSVFEPRR